MKSTSQLSTAALSGSKTFFFSSSRQSNEISPSGHISSLYSDLALLTHTLLTSVESQNSTSQADVQLESNEEIRDLMREKCELTFKHDKQCFLISRTACSLRMRGPK